jgi:hypothetical protein
MAASSRRSGAAAIALTMWVPSVPLAPITAVFRKRDTRTLPVRGQWMKANRPLVGDQFICTPQRRCKRLRSLRRRTQ